MKRFLGIALGIIMAHWTTAALPGDTVEIEDAYARPVPPGQPNSAVFMHIVNRGAAAQVVVGGQSDDAAVVELHSHTMEDGMMRMRRIERIEVPGNGAVSLAPGGMHVMLIGLKRGLTPGDTVNLTLDLDDGTTLDVKAQVRAVQVMDHHPQ
jgi:periplasmic copper chaperone A